MTPDVPRFEQIRLALTVVALSVAAYGCAVSRAVDYEEVDIERAETEVSVNQLIDVGIMIFDPGIPKTAKEQQKELVFPDVRRAEARYMPYHLKNTLEGTGFWGSVWVIPGRSDAVDLLVWGRVDRSNGLEVRLRVGAWDAGGKEWLNKTYDAEVPAKAYAKFRDLSQDPYQNVYNEIANDLLKIRENLSDPEIETIRSIAELRYAADLVPIAFEDHLEQDGKGFYSIKRLPAEGDPMVARLRAVREREYMLVDTLNEYYAGLYYDISKPYEDWRKMSREESIRYKELKRSARMRQLLGLAAILGAVAYEGSGGGNSAVTNTAVIAGLDSVKTGFALSSEANQHTESLRELGMSFDAEAEAVIIEVEGQTRRLTGNAEEKYQEWRRLLHEIYASETGLAYEADLGERGIPVPQD